MSFSFQEIADRLRSALQAHPPRATGNETTVAVRALALDVEREMAVQAVEFLYRTLKHGEQWREAAGLLACALPHSIIADARVRALLQDASALAEKIKDPELERLARYASLVESIDDRFARDLTGLPPRAWYWLQVVRLTGAKTALEYGTGSGSNVFQCAGLEPGVEWWGHDVSAAQIAANTLQAERVGLGNVRFTRGPPAPRHAVVAVLDTLEHTVHPDALLADAESWLEPGGSIVVSVPNGPWSPHTPNERNVGPGQHLAVERVGTLIPKLAARGRVIDVQVLPGFHREGNSSLVATYRPGMTRGTASRSIFQPMKPLRGVDRDDELRAVSVVVGEDASPVASASASNGLEGYKVVFVYPSPSWWGESLPPWILDEETGRSIAGGETYMLENAFGCAEAGAETAVVGDLFREADYRGVSFRRLEGFPLAAYDVLLSVLHPVALHWTAPDAVRLFLQQCNHLWFGFDWMCRCDGVVAASVDHARWLSRQGVWPGPYEIVHNGCAFTRYPTPGGKGWVAPSARGPTVGYWSSPDRGLHHLLRAWPHVLAAEPGAKLRVYYEIERIFQKKHESQRITHWGRMPDMEARLDALERAVREARVWKSVEFMGMVSRKRMIAEQSRTHVMCYPADVVGFTEGFSQATAEALAAGCLALVRPVDAIASLHGDGIRQVQGVPGAPDFPTRLAEQVVKGFNWDGSVDPSLDAARKVGERWSWRNTRAEMVQVIKRAIARKRRQPIPEPAFPLAPL